ncbi:NAD(P)-dependent oxidoreductase [Bifidobacterium tibiigranuli]|jgi:3-hydroxyisobutyrate dehydrogenase|uniref:NAD(P)-dependent oxidoreductase n=1 Tax=Bifidobacterium tibiigranuli TaxID=2172043 RepID=UPI0026EB3D74|nr:NAD(P)-dependent oxidoreductase [Bifidobacterium tibiigranuli]MCI1649470.1 NAD(P)-dependent oxidoreductase [Bifidobacterium tibiigranuli]MCI2186168.1 NAD(P)-dependent oxidoreductase [Bifidobacterium tibiigranuli]MCI2204005.1 NAD(P)-dependent oxidoreductase [Bifidobacterium tibiigranuli]
MDMATTMKDTKTSESTEATKTARLAKVTVLGTGIMGGGIAKTLAAAGFAVTAWNRTPAHAEPLREYGVKVESELADALAEADVILVVVYDAASVLDVLGRGIGAAFADAVWVQMATIGVEGAHHVAQLAEQQGAHLVETMMMGSKDQAESGALTLIAGGQRALFDQAGPVLDAISTKLVYCGESVGSGSVVKLACNLWLACITSAACQSVELLKGEGVDPQLFLDVITGMTTDSPYAHLKGGKAIAGDFSAQFEVNALLKDLGLVGEVMAGSGFRTDLLERQQTLYDQVREQGHGHDDVSAVALAFESPRG